MSLASSPKDLLPAPRKRFGWNIRALVLIPRPPGLEHPGIILHVDGTWAWAQTGTSNPSHKLGDLLHVVRKEDAEFRHIKGLRGDTYFYEKSLWMVRVDEVLPWRDGGYAPVALWKKLRDCVQHRLVTPAQPEDTSSLCTTPPKGA